MRKSQDVPPAREINQRVEDLGEGKFILVQDEGYEICSWVPGPPGSGPPTQVHMLLPLGVDGLKVVLRLKSARALDELVGVLLDYRKEVFGGSGS